MDTLIIRNVTLDTSNEANMAKQNALFREQCELVIGVTSLWVKQGLNYKTWLTYRNYFLINAMQITPLQLNVYV